MFREWLIEQLDYISFWDGLAFLLLAVICVRAARWERGGRIPWLRLALFGLAQGLNEWLAMLALSLSDPPVFKLVRTAVMAVSFMALLSFGRHGWRALGHRAPGRWIVLLLLAVGCAGWLWGSQGLDAAFRYSLGFPGAMLAAAVFLRAAALADAHDKTGFLLAAGGMFLYAGAVGLVAPKAPFWPASRLNYDSFVDIAGFPVQLLCTFCAFACMAGVWLHGRAVCPADDRDSLTGRWILPSALVLLIALGWIGTDWRGRVTDGTIRQDLLRQASGIARSIDPEQVRKLSFTPDDRERPEFRSIREQMIAYGLFAGLRCVYSVAQRGDAFVFGPENLDEKDPLASPPGTVYQKPDPELGMVFRNMQRLSIGPYTDEYGAFLSAFSPVVDRHSGEVLLTVGVDIMADRWRSAVSGERLRAILLTLVLTVVILSGLSFLEWRRWFPREERGWWFRNAESIHIAILGLVLTAVLVMTAHDLEKRRNLEDFVRLAEAQAQIVGESFRDIRRVLSDLARFFESDAWVHSRKFETFAGHMARSSCVQALGWIQVVTAGEKDEFEAGMRSQGFDAFQVFDRNAGGERMPAAGRDEYYPITFLTPFQENRMAMGYDPGGDAIRREVLQKAAGTRLPAATPPTVLVHEGGEHKGVLVYQPVFREGKSRPFGFVVCVVKLQPALKQTLAAGGGTDPHIAVDIVDTTPIGELYPLAAYPEKPVHPAAAGLARQEVFRSVHPLFMVDRTWAVVARPCPAFLEAHRSWIVLLTGLAGLLTTMVMSVFVGFLGSRQATLERKVLERTRALRESEERLRLAMDATSEGLWDWDVRTGVVHFSPQWIRQLGYSPEEVPPTIEFMQGIVHPEDLPRVKEVVQAHFSGGTAVFECEDRLRMKSGAYRHNLHRGKVVDRDANGQPLRMVGADLDITERIRAEQELRSSKMEVETILESLQSGLMIVDTETHVIVEANPAACRMIGLSRAHVVGNVCHRFICPAEAGDCPITDRGQVVDNSDRILLTAGGEAMPILKTVVPIVLGERRCLLESFVDIGDRKRAEDALRSTMNELEISNSQLEEAIARANEMAALAEMASIAKSQFLANMSHEIRTPMNGVIGMTGLLLDTDLTPEQRQFAEIVRSSGDNLLSLINNILDFSKIEAGKLELEMLDFDLRTTMEDVVEMLAVKAHEKKLELTCLVEPGVPPFLRGDPGRLRQIVVNLVSNAMKFTNEGEVAIRIGIEEETEADATLRFTIRDTGIGIPEDRQNILFTMFSQVDGSTTRKYGGTGLGLAISRQLAEIMGGRIGVNSREGEGSTFWFTVVLAKQLGGQPGEPQIHAEITGLRALVVDDHETNRLLVSTLLRSWGCRPAEAGDGPTALGMLEGAVKSGDPFRVALIDHQMPEMDGAELGRRIKENPEIGGTRLVLMSSLGQGADTARVGQDRFAAWLTKPLRQGQLRQCLMSVMGRGGFGEGVPRAAIVTEQKIAGPDRRHFRILLAEDNVINQKVARVMLEKFGYRVDVASNGMETVEALTHIPYDLVLMDCQMPEMDGFDATRVIRSGRSCLNPRVPIVAMTANAMRGDRERCIEAGMNDYIAKPVQPKELAELIDRVLSHARRVDVPPGGSSGVPSPGIPSDGDVFQESDLLGRLMDDRDLAREIVAGFLDDIPVQIGRLRDSLESGDPDGAVRQAHTIKGAAGNVGASAIRALAAELEQLGKEGSLDEVLGRLPLLDAELDRLRHTLKENGWI